MYNPKIKKSWKYLDHIGNTLETPKLCWNLWLVHHNIILVLLSMYVLEHIMTGMDFQEKDTHIKEINNSNEMSSMNG